MEYERQQNTKVFDLEFNFGMQTDLIYYAHYVEKHEKVPFKDAQWGFSFTIGVIIDRPAVGRIFLK